MSYSVSSNKNAVKSFLNSHQENFEMQLSKHFSLRLFPPSIGFDQILAMTGWYNHLRRHNAWINAVQQTSQTPTHISYQQNVKKCLKGHKVLSFLSTTFAALQYNVARTEVWSWKSFIFSFFFTKTIHDWKCNICFCHLSPRSCNTFPSTQV